MGISFASDITLSLMTNPNSGKPYQSWEETGFNTITSLGALRIGYWGIPIQMSYMLAKPYFRAIQEHIELVTYPYHPR